MARALALIGVLTVVLLIASASRAVGEKREPVIPAGRERQVLELFRPYGLGDEIRDGGRLGNVKIEATEVRVEIDGPQEASSYLVLRHRSAPGADGKPTSENFAMFPTGSSPALRVLIKTIRGNDRGGIWLASTSTTSAPNPRFVGGPQQHHFYYVAGGQLALLMLGGLGLWRLRRPQPAGTQR